MTKFDIILAGVRTHTADKKQLGIGLNGRMPWICPEELALFKRKTDNHIIIVGRKTAQSLPKLPNRTVLCLSKNTLIDKRLFKNPCSVFQDLNSALKHASDFFPEKTVFIAGGADLYTYVLKEHNNNINKIHLSIMSKDYFCNKFIDFDIKNFTIEHKEDFSEFTHYTLNTIPTFEKEYLNLLQDVLTNGSNRETRNGMTKSMFGKNLKFDLRKGFPILTTRKMFWKGIVEELLFFIKGETNSKLLEEKGVMIWKGNTSRDFLDSLDMQERSEGMMGPMYGFQWRHFNGFYDEKTGRGKGGVDQFKEVIDTIINDSTSRRILMTTFNPEQVKQGVLYPCHSITLQFYVENNFLDVFCYNRSSDLFHGLPFNISSTALLLSIIAKLTELTPRFLFLSLGDCHIYKQHFNAAKELLDRPCYEPPVLDINEKINEIDFISDTMIEKSLEDLQSDYFNLVNYTSGSSIKVDMVV